MHGDPILIVQSPVVKELKQKAEPNQWKHLVEEHVLESLNKISVVLNLTAQPQVSIWTDVQDLNLTNITHTH